MWSRIDALILILATTGFAADRYVLTNGTDSGTAESWGTAWRTLAHAEVNCSSGDTINIGQGDFGEYVQINGPHSVRWYSPSNAVTRAFRVETASNTFDGITLDKACDEGGLTWNAFMRLYPGADSTVVTNCKFLNVPWVMATNVTFDADTDTITCPDVDFVSAGFKASGHATWGGVSYTNGPFASWAYANLGGAGSPTDVSETTLTFSDGVIVAETNSSTWALIHAGSGTYTPNAILFDVEGGGTLYPTGCVVTTCLFSNWMGIPIIFSGGDHMLTNCEFTAIWGHRCIKVGGYNIVLSSNYFHDCHAPAYYSFIEDEPYVGHSGAYYDYISQFITYEGTTLYQSNIWFIGNWLENIDQPLANIGPVVTSEMGQHGSHWIGNVFVGMTKNMDGGCTDTYMQSNTFFRCSYIYGANKVCSLGGSLGMTNMVFTHNLFAECGDHQTPTNEGFFGFANVLEGLYVSNNFVCGLEALNWNAMLTAASAWSNWYGTTGGDPLFVDRWNPRGPDGIPWTADDGLRIKPGSAAEGAGALPLTEAGSAASFAYFDPIIVLGSNYWDATGTNYNIEWHTNTPAFLRTGHDRPWTTADIRTNIPYTVNFSASNSISGTWSTNDWVGIRDFVWDFGDGSRPIWTKWPRVTHTYLTTGEVKITLTVTNSATNSSSFSRRYRLLPTTNWFTDDIFYVATNGSPSGDGSYADPFLYVTQAIHVATPGDYICVMPGRHTNSLLNMGYQWGVDGTASDPISLVGYDATIGYISDGLSFWNFEGFKCESPDLNDPSTVALIRCPNPETDLLFRNLLVDHGGAQAQQFIDIAASGGIGGSNITIQNCAVIGLAGQSGMFTMSGASNVLITENIAAWSTKQSDIRIDGYDITISRNYYYAHGFTNGNHADFIVWVGGTLPFLGNYVVEQNWFEMPSMEYQYSLAKTNVVVLFDGTPNEGDSLTINGITRYWTNDASDSDWMPIGTNAAQSRLFFYTNAIDYPWDATWIVKFSETFGNAVDVRGDVLEVMTASATGSWYDLDYVYYHSMPTQIANTGTDQNGLLSHSNFVFRNNVLMNVWNGWNPVASDGFKCYNNLFYKCAAGNDTVIVHGNRYNPGSSWGTDIRNNLFFECGNTTNDGFYINGTRVVPNNTEYSTNGTLAADFNFICWTNFEQNEYWTEAADDPIAYWQYWAIPFLSAGDITNNPVVPIYDQQGLETNGINGVDPLFNNEGAYDFRLQSESPLLGAGTDLSSTGFDYDFFGRTRPASWAIGPFESVDFAGGGGGDPDPPAETNYTRARFRGNQSYRGNVIFR